ncbi:hypothetical protein H8693_08495 [Christensenellaceae bacterium NSJ-63]|uniref:Phosphotriesterase-related protein n=1 Tax=Guopingia tenuis TaxID=2763656 RepID=A0A926HXP5_9FIRM|nr:phosphotriesterase [Guopingia tenuis]MBC8538971.1 hypothetical protein [Guopingia tenuis]
MAMEGMVRTVLGDIAPADLGWCQCHEHVFLEKGRSFELHKALLMDDYEKSQAELFLYKNAGGSALVDAQPGGGGRMAERMVRAAKATGLHLIASAGFHKTVFYYDDSFLFRESEEQLADRFIREIEEGMLSSQMDGERRLPEKAGILKVAVDEGGLHRDATYEKLFHAAAATVKATGVSILAHFEKNSDAFEVLRFFEDAGIPANRLLACHLDRTRHDLGYHRELAAAGAYLEYDTINRLKYVSNEQEIALIQGMLEAGYQDQLLFSLDTTNERLASYGAPMGLDFILKHFSGMLEQAGVGKEILRHVMVENAARAIAIQAV